MSNFFLALGVFGIIICIISLPAIIAGIPLALYFSHFLDGKHATFLHIGLGLLVVAPIVIWIGRRL